MTMTIEQILNRVIHQFYGCARLPCRTQEQRHASVSRALCVSALLATHRQEACSHRA